MPASLLNTGFFPVSVPVQRVNSHYGTCLTILEKILAMGNFVGSPTLPPHADLASTHSYHLACIANLVRQRAMITLVLPAFPAKSPNRRKTISALPDMAELLALRRLNDLCTSIKAGYAPGARVVLCSDGRIFSDIVGVSDNDITRYGQHLDGLIRDFGLNHIGRFSLEDLSPHRNFADLRTDFLGAYAPSLLEVRYLVKTSPNEQNLFNGMQRFLFEDGLVLAAGKSRNQVRKQAKDDCYELIRRSTAWSRLISQHFSQHVRLSIHPQQLGSPKLGVKLLPGGGAWATPWHNVALWNGQAFSLVKRQQADDAGAQLLFYSQARLAYYCLR